jgi:hypothetical protein
MFMLVYIVCVHDGIYQYESDCQTRDRGVTATVSADIAAIGSAAATSSTDVTPSSTGSALGPNGIATPIGAAPTPMHSGSFPAAAANPNRSTPPPSTPTSNHSNTGTSSDGSVGSSAPPPLVRQLTNRAQKLQQVFGNSTSQRLQMAVESTVLDSSSDAGRARARFLKNLPVLEKKPDTMLQVIRSFMDNLKAHIEQKKMNEIRRTMGQSSGSTGPLPGEEDSPLDIRLERAVQTGVVQPAYARIITTIRRQCMKEDETINSVLVRLREHIGADQTFYGIPTNAHNIHGWQVAVEELNDLGRTTLPADKIQALLRAAKAIYHTFNEDRAARDKAEGKPEKKGQYFLSADDFFPSAHHNYTYHIQHMSLFECTLFQLSALLTFIS